MLTKVLDKLEQLRPKGAKAPTISGDVVMVARRIVASRARRVGFAPADPRCQTPAAMGAIAAALAEISDHGIATVHAPRGLGHGSSAARESSIWSFTKEGSVSHFIPSRAPRPGEWLHELGRFLASSLGEREMALIDFTGLRDVGELATAADMVDACCVVARARKTREADLESACLGLPPDRFLGVLLT